MEWGTFQTDGWSSPTVRVARTFRERFNGLRPRPSGQGILLPGRSVHGFGMKERLLVVGLDDGARVIGVRILFPRRFAAIPGAHHILELPIEQKAPRQGAVLTWVGGGSPDCLRNTDRQPR